MLKLTLDTNCIENEGLHQMAVEVGAELAAFSVSRNETKGSGYEVYLKYISIIPDQSVWKDGRWADGVWGDRSWNSGPNIVYAREDGSTSLGDPFENVLGVISNHSFPPPEARKHLSKGQRRQFRDAMLLSLHAQHGRDIFVSRDKKAFVNEGRRELLERMLATRICTPEDAIGLLSQLARATSSS
ncbi:MAG TPA: hypothetical protein VFA99_03025 [Acidobacteriaceae bacterium]|nr:hypothetical protein [Acidobacteriaceae bacterium]